jgi:DNA repair exonuclease SbcCD ATPase subunit
LTAKLPQGMQLTKEEAEIFQRRLEMVRQQLDEIDQEVERELKDVRERIAALQEKRKSALKVYDAACTMLGIDNDLAQEGDSGTGLG